MQIGYNQTPNTYSPYASPVVNQPGSSMPPPAPVFNSSPQPPYPQQQSMPPISQQQQSPYQQNQGAMPDGPVGGVAGYDPQLHAKMAGMSVHTSFSRLWVIILFLLSSLNL